jgi:Sulfotransferase domain
MFDALKERFQASRYGEPIVVVSGLPRSGTSMMMKMLESGGLAILMDGERKADVDNPNGYYEVERVKNLEKETDKSWLRAARGKVIKVISFLIKDLPDDNRYKVLFLRRDLDEVIRSQDKMIARLGTENASADAEAMKEAYRNDIVRTRLFCKSRANFDLMEVHYKGTIEDPLATAKAVNAFLGGKLDEEKMRTAVQAELYRNRSA